MLSAIEDKANLIKRKVIASYIENISDDKIKKLLIADIESEKNLFYFCYASLFADNDNALIEQINIAGFFYFKYLIHLDALIDNKEETKEQLKKLDL